MKINWETSLYCLIGSPVNKSLSPQIHNYLFELNDMNCVYLSFDVEKNDLEKVLESFKILRVKGFNITIPHKIEIIKYLDDIDDEAKLLGAVNTVKNINGKLIGYNTDGAGFVKSLKDRDIDIIDKSFLILGAGGASHGIATKLAMEGANKIIILNRTVEKAKKLALNISNKFVNVEIIYDSLEKFISYSNVDVVVNCTSVGMYPDIAEMPVNPSCLNRKTVVCDIVYKPIETKFLNVAKKNDLYTIGGIDMLINQGILSQQIWFDNQKKYLVNIDKIKGNLHNTVE